MEYKVFYHDGKTEVLLNVPAYSFNWQMAYRPQAPIRIPAGSRIQVTGYFDNSTKNKFNPDPEAQVSWGERTIDEMGASWISYYYMSEEDFKKESAERKAKQQTRTAAR